MRVPTTFSLSRSADGLIETLSLNRPAALNAINSTMLHELTNYFGSLIEADKGLDASSSSLPPPPRVVIIRGEGKGFCGGLDLADTGGFADKNLYVSLSSQSRLSEMIVRMRKCPQPIIAVLHGATCGGGLALALAADVRVVTPDLKANVAMATIGLSGCDMGISYHLPRVVGSGIAAELMMSGRFLGAERAERVGFANSIKPTVEQALGEAVAIAKDMIGLNPMGLALTKSGLNASLSASSLDSQVALEDRQQVLIATLPDFHQRASDFLAKKATGSKSKL